MPHVQIRNVPPRLHSTLKKRAAKKGVSLSEYLREEPELLASQPTLEEAIERTRSRPPVYLDRPAAEYVREARKERERELERRAR